MTKRLYKFTLAALIACFPLGAYAQSTDKTTLAANIEEILNACDRTQSVGEPFERVSFDENYVFVIQYPRQTGPIRFGMIKIEVPMTEVSVTSGNYITFTCHSPGCIKEYLPPTPLDHNGKVQTRLVFLECDSDASNEAGIALQKLSELLSAH